MRQTTKQAARGKWDDILTELIGQQAVTRKHGPCPICGGTDRYRYDNKRNDGDWYCNVCGPGDGFRLLSESLGISFSEAASRVDRLVNRFEEKPFKPQLNIEKRRAALNEMWSSAHDAWIAGDYLMARGIPKPLLQEIKDIRGHAKLFYTDMSKPSNVTYESAMLALIRNKDGEPVSIHRTYILKGKKEKKIMPPLENITGGCVRLGEPTDRLILAEGIETALAAWTILDIPAWATISAHGLSEFKEIPGSVKKVIVAADNDYSFTGQAAAFTCAKYMKNRLKVETVVTMPKVLGMDMLDVLQDLSENNLHVKGIEHQLGLLRWAP